MTTTNTSPRRLLSNNSTSPNNNRKYRVYIAVGSNVGDSFQNIYTGLTILCDPNYYPSQSSFPTNNTNNTTDTDFIESSFLYKATPMYKTDQPCFWNGVVEVWTDLDPYALLLRLKNIEQDMGRNLSTNIELRNGPRPLDLDILLYFNNDPNNNQNTISYNDELMVRVNTKDLIIPHVAMHEKEFVLRPLIDLTGMKDLIHPSYNLSMGKLLEHVHGNNNVDEEKAVRILPLPRGRCLVFNETIIMGILNVTPDSFSDGGNWTDSVDQAVDRAMEMIAQGATIIDIGGESTRPGATEIPVSIQIQRVVPVIQRIRAKDDLSKDAVLSIDTRHAARAAIEAGVDMVNDVSGGTFDDDMLPTVEILQVPIIMMHMRGTPETMQSLVNYEQDGGVVESVVQSLLERSEAAKRTGIPRWMQVLDVGFGFVKDMESNLSLLKHYNHIRSRLTNYPLLLGTSRKGFIG